MSNTKQNLIILMGILAWICILGSCSHEPFLADDIEPDPKDTTTNPMDTTVMGIPCDSNIIYFNKDILPILLGSCAISGCHDVVSANDGVKLNNYDNVINTAEVTPFDLSESKLYKVITENDADDVMPPTGKLDNDKISIIAQWILQGAKDLECDEPTDCLTDNISYSGFIKGLFDTSCNGCHSTVAASGGVILDTYSGVKSIVNGGRLYGAINWDQGYQQMPQAQSQLDSCIIAKVKTWIDDGAPNN